MNQEEKAAKTSSQEVEHVLDVSSTGTPVYTRQGACAPCANPEKLPQSLNTYTPARVQLQRTGHSLATSEILQLQLANAQARDAVHATLDVPALLHGLEQRKLAHFVLTSAATNRADYLRNPALGRTLSEHSVAILKNVSAESANLRDASGIATDAVSTTHDAYDMVSCDIVFVVADGLSALAVDRHALPLLDAVLPLLDPAWRIAPICVVEQGRVAIADPIGKILGAKISVILIGERPGLSSPDSLGVYITWNPRIGRTDAERNCISNIRPEGLSYQEAAALLHFYLIESRRLQHTGTMLKPSNLPASGDLPNANPARFIDTDGEAGA
jgi:ethanolamine ammonia-lyase small subunit